MRFLTICFLLGCLLPILSGERKEPTLGAGIIDRLIDPTTRTEAFREVKIAKQGEDPLYDWKALPLAAFELRHPDIQVSICPQLDGQSPLYMVSYRWAQTSFREHYSKRSLVHGNTFKPVENAHKPKALRESTALNAGWRASADDPHLSRIPEHKLEERVIVFLTAEGRVVWPFQGNNMTEGDVIKDLNGDGRLERVYSSSFRLYDRREGEPDIWVQAVRVEAVSLESGRHLYVLLNWHPRNQSSVPIWGWAVRDLDDDGIDEIFLGPVPEEDADPDSAQAKAVFHWDADRRQYVGPEGGLDQHFFALDTTVKLWDALRRVKAAGGLQYAPEIVAPETQKSVEEEAPYDWRERKPYTYQSLAGSSNEALLDFMCGWSPATTANEVEHKQDPRFEFKPEWRGRSPKDAMWTFVEENESERHRDKYLLYYPTNLTEPEPANWVVLSGLGQEQFQFLQLSDKDTARQISVRHRRSLRQRYPHGDFKWEWKVASRDGRTLRWMKDALWWLAQLRSEPRSAEEGFRISSTGVTSRCFPTHMEETLPGVRLLANGGAVATDIQAERARAYPSSWRHGYGAEQFLGFASRLYAALERHAFRGRAEKRTLQELLDSIPNFVEKVDAGHLPPQLVRAVVRAAGDSGEASYLPLLHSIQARMPEPSDFEMQAKRLRSELESIAGQQGMEAYRQRLDLEARLAELERPMRSNMWPWLREPLPMAIRQLEAADDVATLRAWAAQPDSPGALWALTRLKEMDVGAWKAVLEEVFAQHPKMRRRLVDALRREHREFLDGLIAPLPRLEQLELVPSRVGSHRSAELGPELVEKLLATILEEELSPDTRVAAIRKLAPRDEPRKVMNPAVDRALLDVIRQESFQRTDKGRWSERRLSHEAALMLLLRGQRTLPVEQCLKAAEDGGNPFSYGSFLFLVIDLAVAKESTEAREWLLDWAYARIAKDEGAWSRFVDVVYTADIQELRPFVARLATFDSGAVEGDSGRGKGRHPSLAATGRYHRARQTMALWSETDALTRAKCLVLWGYALPYHYTPEGLYGPLSRVEADLDAAHAQFSPEERIAFGRFLGWCKESIPRNRKSYRGGRFVDGLLNKYVAKDE